MKLVLLRNCTYKTIMKSSHAYQILLALNRNKKCIVCEYGDDRYVVPLNWKIIFVVFFHCQESFYLFQLFGHLFSKFQYSFLCVVPWCSDTPIQKFRFENSLMFLSCFFFNNHGFLELLMNSSIILLLYFNFRFNFFLNCGKATTSKFFHFWEISECKTSRNWIYRNIISVEVSMRFHDFRLKERVLRGYQRQSFNNNNIPGLNAAPVAYN